MLTMLMILVPATAWMVTMVAAPEHAHLVGLILLVTAALRVVLAVARVRRGEGRVDRDGAQPRATRRRYGGAVRGAADARLVRAPHDLPDAGVVTSRAQPLGETGVSGSEVPSDGAPGDRGRSRRR